MLNNTWRTPRTQFKVIHRMKGQLGYTVKMTTFNLGAAMNFAEHYMRSEGGHALVEIM